jgi:hypothetical protein
MKSTTSSQPQTKEAMIETYIARLKENKEHEVRIKSGIF